MDDILKLEKVADYRFASMVKGEHFAFARGLTINPTHLPAALDAMLKDGYELVSMFGNPGTTEMGLIFRRVGPDKRVQELLEANTKLVLENRSLKTWIRGAASQFKMYMESHRAKGTPDGDHKAKTNEAWTVSAEELLRNGN